MRDVIIILSDPNGMIKIWIFPDDLITLRIDLKLN